MVDNKHDEQANGQNLLQMQEEYKKMLEESFARSSEINRGDVVEGQIISITDNLIFVSLGGKYDAYAEVEDYRENGTLPLQVGDTLKGFVISVKDGEIVISKSLSKKVAQVDRSEVRNAFEAHIPVKGKVFAQVKGGFSVDILGARSFCPFSQIDIRPADDPQIYLNQSYDFMIIEFSENGRNIIVSRKVILDLAYQEKKESVMSQLEVGKVMKGRVMRFASFGAFIDLGGIEGLLHVSEISWNRVERPEEVLKAGEEVDVKIIRLEGDKISLSMKALTENPMEAAYQELKEGEIVKCRILRLQPFGAFAELSPGVEGLIPVSEMSRIRRVHHPKEILHEGDLVEVQILRVDAEARKLSLSLKALEKDPWDEIDTIAVAGQEINGYVENVSNFGVFVTIQEGVTGLLPRSRMRSSVVMNPGEAVTLRVSAVDKEHRRISLDFVDALPENEQDAPRNNNRDDNRGRFQDRNNNQGNNDRGDRKQRGRGGRENEDWKRYATETKDMSEDNPFNDLLS